MEATRRYLFAIGFLIWCNDSLWQSDGTPTNRTTEQIVLPKSDVKKASETAPYDRGEPQTGGPLMLPDPVLIFIEAIPQVTLVASETEGMSPEAEGSVSVAAETPPKKEASPPTPEKLEERPGNPPNAEGSPSEPAKKRLFAVSATLPPRPEAPAPTTPVPESLSESAINIEFDSEAIIFSVPNGCPKGKLPDNDGICTEPF